MKNKNIRRILIFLVVLAGVSLVLLYRQDLNTNKLKQWIDSAGGLGPVLFVLVYIVATILFLPGSILTFVGGSIFGPLWGSVYTIIGATIGATLAFLIARYLGFSWVRTRLENKSGGRVQELVQGVENEGWRFVVFVRLVPLFPFNALNYALGLTRIKVLHYSLASLVGMLPGTIAYTYLGFAARETIAGQDDIQKTIETGLIATALLTLVAYLPRIINKLRR